ncbi:MAG: choice-of-anchor L domain-containing protein [Bacteroidetes bacterium]|nr:choice-of-anchor L domain-containing protein [Bacteroidota bacterium]
MIVLLRLAFALTLLTSIALPTRAQLVIQEGIPIDSLVRTYFIGGGAQVSNITYKGFPRGIGYFNGTRSNIGIDEGVLLTSGWVRYAIGPNNDDDITFPALAPGDADLSNLVKFFTLDAAVLEFDFVPFQDTVRFEYVFGSEEYQEFVGSVYNDVFAFFISGPGFSGKENIALIPGTNIPVAINNVNHLQNIRYYIDNPVGIGQTVQYDGFTTVLEASAAVTPCQSYHLKLAIADVGDNLLDSGVFLKSGSFDAGNMYSVVGLRDAVENGCQPGIIEIQRLGKLSDSVTVFFHIRGDASNGTDYTSIPSKVTFLQGQGSIRIPIEAIADTIPDGGEWVTIFIEDICKTGLVRDSIRILEVPPFDIHGLRDTALCQGQNLRLEARITGGSGSFTYEWTGGDRDRIFEMNPAREGTYEFSVRDSLTGCEKFVTVHVTIEAPPFVDAGPDKVICPGGITQIEAVLSGENPPYQVVWTPPHGLSNPNTVSPEASPQQTTTYRMTATSPGGCVAEDTVTVFVSRVLVDMGPDSTICAGSSVTIGGEAAGGVPPYTYQWSPSAAVPNPGVPQNTVSPRTTTTYYLRIRSSNGCVVDDSVTITVSDIRLDAGPDIRICEGESRTIGDTAWSTDHPVVYTWEPVEGLDNPFSATPAAAPDQTTTYIITAVSDAGCVARDTVRVYVNRLVIDAGPSLAFCPGDSVQLEPRIIEGTSPFTYRWAPSVGLSATDIASPYAAPRVSMWYILTVTDAAGCVREDSVLVTVWPEPAPRIDVQGSPVFCIGDSVRLDAGAGYASYQWSTGARSRSITTGNSGRYWVEVTSVDGCRGISDTVEVLVSEKPAPRITGPLSLCAGEYGQYAVPEIIGSTYDWTLSGGTLQSGQGTPVIEVLWDIPGVYTIRIDQVFGAASCRGDTTITIIVHPLPAPVISADGRTAFCEGESVRLSAADGFAGYRWSTGDSTRSITVNRTGSYHVTVTSDAGCEGTSPPVEITVYPLPSPRIDTQTAYPVCVGDSVVLRTTQSYAGYLWSDGSRASTVTVREAGTYSVTVTTENGCTGVSQPFTVQFLALPSPRIVADGPLEFCDGGSVRLRTEEEYARYAWSGGDTIREITVRRSGVHTVTVWTGGGCRGESAPVVVTVHPWPDRPEISRAGDSLMSTAAFRYQWYEVVNGQPVLLNGEDGRILRSRPDTPYRVRIWNEFGCDTISLPFAWRIEEVLTPAATVALPVVEANPGEIVTIDLRLTAQEQLSEAAVRSYASQLRFNGSLLVPIGSTPEGRMEGDQRIIHLTGVYDSTNNLLARLEFLATLGNAASTPLFIESFEWDRPDVVLTRVHGEFRLGVCREGGARLFDATGTLALEPNHPNPFNSMTVITFEVIEDGQTELFVLDVLGRRVATLLNADIEAGRYQIAFEAGDLPSGIYVSVLRTPTQLRMRHMRLLK